MKFFINDNYKKYPILKESKKLKTLKHNLENFGILYIEINMPENKDNVIKLSKLYLPVLSSKYLKDKKMMLF